MTTLSTRNARIADLIAEIQTEYPDVWATVHARAELLLREREEPYLAVHGG